MKAFISEDGIINYDSILESDDFELLMNILEELQQINLVYLSELDLKSFLINCYNFLIIHGTARFGTKYLDKVSYLIGGESFKLQTLHQMILDEDKRINEFIDPRIHFAIIYSGNSYPKLHVYEGKTINEILHQATCNYLNTTVQINMEKKKINLPKLMSTYRDHWPKLKQEFLLWIVPYLDTDKKNMLTQLSQKGIELKLNFENTILETFDIKSLKKIRNGGNTHESLPIA